MSRIGKLPVKLPTKVEATFNNKQLIIKGPFGNLNLEIPNEIDLNLTNDQINVIKNQETRIAKQKHGLIRSLVQNMVTGVTKQFEQKLEMVGVGYRATLQGSNLILNVGYSHPITFKIPDELNIKIENNTKLIIKGIDKEKVGLFSSKIRAIRPPEPYKGKGIKYENETILRKAGKSGK